MKQLLTTLLIVMLPAVGLRAESIEEQVENIGQWLDDVSRMEEGHQLLEQLLSQPDIQRQPLYPQMLYLKSYYFIRTGDMNSAKQQLLALQELLPAKGLDDLGIYVQNDLGVCYRREGQNDSALYYYDQALQAAQQLNDLEWQASLNLNIGVLHHNLNHYVEAEQFLDRAVTQVRQVDDPYTELCALQVNAAVKLRLKKYDEARANIEPAYQLALESESPDWQLRCLAIMLSLYGELQQTDSAAVTLERGNALLAQRPQQSIDAVGYLVARANYNYTQGQWQQAADDYTTLLDNETAGTKTMEGYTNLAQCYQHLQQWPLAYRYMDSARACAYRMGEENFASQMADFNVKYQTIEKDLEITRLQAQRTRSRIIALAASLVALLLLAGFWLWQRQRRYRRDAQIRIDSLEDERRRIAKELHDGLCNDMLVLEMTLQQASDDRQDTVAKVHGLRQQARKLSHELMPPQFTHTNLSQLVRLYAAAVERGTTISATFTDQAAADGHWDNLSADVSLQVYRIMQEQVGNIIHSSTATHIDIRLATTSENHYLLAITDDGLKTATPSDGGIGQMTLKDRALSIGAELSEATADGLNHFELRFKG